MPCGQRLLATRKEKLPPVISENAIWCDRLGVQQKSISSSKSWVIAIVRRDACKFPI